MGSVNLRLRGKQAVSRILDSPGCSALLQRTARLPGGRGILNCLSTYRRAFPTFEKAWKAAHRKHPAGHESTDNVRLHLSLSKKLRVSDYAALHWLERIGSRPLDIFDYGGNVGNLYYSYSPQLEIGNWRVFDIPAVREAGVQIARERNVRNLYFVNAVQGDWHPSVLLISGAFHYWEKGIREFLEQFSEPPEHILINRSPVHPEQMSFITVQSTDSFAVPCRVWNRTELISGFEKAGYSLVDSWNAPELSLKLPLFPELSVHEYSGFYFRRQHLR